MSRDWKQWEGRVVNGSLPLRQYLGGSDRSAVFLTERRGREPQKAAIKLITVDPANTGKQLAQWELAAKLSHPHLLRLFETGSCQLDNVVLLYVVMEYAEENLAQILPQRPLTPVEARDLLEPALDALAFIHGKSLVHGRLKPSNIMAAQDQLKLSSDSLVRSGDPIGALRPSPYDAPEMASGKITPASDSWSLGMTLMEALTQRLPTRDGMTEPMPETVPAPFMGIAHCCLRRDPQRRCAAADIAARLRSTSSSPLSSSLTQKPSTLRIPAAAAKWRYLLPIAVVVLAAAALLIGPKLINSHPEAQPATSVSPQTSSETSTASAAAPSSDRPKAPTKLESASSTAAKPSARRIGSVTRSAPVAAQPVDQIPSQSASVKSIPAESIPPADEAPGTAAVSGEVLQQTMPAVSKSARDTIHGTIRVRVKVQVDRAGNVQNASFVSPGPSKYFASKAIEAAQQWKFVPARANGRDPRSWIVRFGFKRSGTESSLESANP
ncbi:MAG: TonB family protein [Terriglobales bacterium]